MRKGLKHSADFQTQDFKMLMDKNEPLRQILQKRNRIDERKLANKRASKVILDAEVKQQMQRTEKEFLRKNAESIRASFFREPATTDGKGVKFRV